MYACNASFIYNNGALTIFNGHSEVCKKVAAKQFATSTASKDLPEVENFQNEGIEQALLNMNISSEQPSFDFHQHIPLEGENIEMRNNDDKFQKAIIIIQKQVDVTQRIVFGEKLTLALLASNEHQDVSQPSISVHGSDVNSNEITETFSEMLKFGDTEIDDLTDAQTFELKRLRATEKALLEKMQAYQFQQVQQQRQYQSKITQLQTQLRQGEIEKEAELADKLEATSMKEQNRGNQIKTAAVAFKENHEKLTTTEAWLQSLAYCKANGFFDVFDKVGEPICDAIILPKCPLLFKEKEKPFKQMQDFLTQMGLPVSIVCQAAKKDCVFVQLEDSRNIFTPELLAKIRAAVSVLALRTYRVLRKKGHDHKDKELLAQMLMLYVRQIDFTQDISGSVIFSLSLETPCTDLFDAIKELSVLIEIPYSGDYNQLLTCIQLADYDISGQIQERIKIYNKLVHLLTCGQFKKTLNMALDKLLFPSLAFYQNKILPTSDKGLSRIEYSAYFNSYNDYNLRFLLQQTYLKRVDDTLAALNQLRHKFYYKISLELMLNSYFTFCKTQLVAFDNNVQMIAYSYNSRSYTFAGVVNNKTRHSPSNLVFLKKYVAIDGNALVFLQGKELGEITKNGSDMQIPIHSFNSKHEQKLVKIQQENLHFNIGNTAKIEINTGDKLVAEFLGITCNRLGYQSDEEMNEVKQEFNENGRINMNLLEAPVFVESVESVESQQIDTHSPETKALELLQNEPLAPAKRKLKKRPTSFRNNIDESQFNVAGNKREQKGNDKHKKKKEKERQQEPKISEEDKQNQQIGRGIDVSELVKTCRNKFRNWKEFNEKGQKSYGDSCLFVSTDRGSTYDCESCDRRLKTSGRSKEHILLI